LDEALARGRLTATRVIAANVGWNAMGRILPLLIAVLATPRLVALLGIDRWGVFTLALSLVGIFGVFDLGIGRALTRSVAERLGAGETGPAADIAWTGLVLIAALGLVGGGALAAAVGSVTRDVLVMPEALRPEAAHALYLLCLAVPLAVINAALWGVLAACQQFRAANLVNLPVLGGYYLGPLLVLPIWDDLLAVIATLLLCRVAMTIAYWRLAVLALPALRAARFDRAAIAGLLRIGGWMTVSNLVQPLLLYLDRFVVAAMLSVAATAYYATAYDLVTRAWVIPVSIMNAVFPAIAAAFRGAPETAARLYRRAALAVLGLLFFPSLVLVLGAHFGLRLWLGAAFAQLAAPVLGWLAVGLLFNCVAFVPTGLLDGIGRSDASAKWAVAQAVVYVPLLLATIRLFGIEGAAMAWSLRVVADCGVRLGLGAWLYPPARQGLGALFGLLGVAGMVLLCCRILVE